MSEAENRSDDNEQTQVAAQPVTTDASQAKDTVEGLPLPSTDNTVDEPGKSPSDVNKETSVAQPQESTSETTPDVDASDNTDSEENN